MDDRAETEKGSHRPGQLPSYFELAHHHYPDAPVDLTYLTPPMAASLDAPGAWARYSHVTWDAVVLPAVERDPVAEGLRLAEEPLY